MNLITLIQQASIDAHVYSASSKLTEPLSEYRLLCGRTTAAWATHRELMRLLRGEATRADTTALLARARTNVLRDLGSRSEFTFWWAVGWVQQLTEVLDELKELQD